MSTHRQQHPRPGPFLAVPRRPRSDGWTPDRQARFLGMLAETGCVAAAARAVGMTRQTAYRLRRRPGAESFAAAWDRALGRASGAGPKVTPAMLFRRATEDLLWPVVHRGKFKQVFVKHDNLALLKLMALSRRGQLARLRRAVAATNEPGLSVKRAVGLTRPLHPPTQPPVCGARCAPSGPPLAPSPVEGRLPVTWQG